MLKQELRSLIKPASVDFNEGNHTYVHKGTGEFYTGCTTISDAWDKSFFLGPWYAKEMAEFILSRPYDEIIRLDPQSFQKFIIGAKSAAKQKSEKAKTDGTAAHDEIERRIKAKIDPDGKYESKYLGSDEAVNAFNAFSAWESKHNITWLASEEVLSSDHYKIAGKLDAIAIVDGIPSIVDFKTSGQLSASYILQCAGYDLMLSEMGFKVRQYIILRVPKDGAPAETLTISDPKEMAFAMETFLHQREAHKFYVYAENKLKDGATHKMKVDAPATVIEVPKPTPIPKVRNRSYLKTFSRSTRTIFQKTSWRSAWDMRLVPGDLTIPADACGLLDSWNTHSQAR